MAQVGDGSTALVFAPPATQLGAKITTTVAPTAGRGVALDGTGSVPAGALPMRFGVATLTWPGAQAFSTALEVAHNLGRTPTIRMASIDGLGMSGLNAFPTIVAYQGATGNTGFQAWTIDNQSPANGSTARFYWLVM